MQIYRVLDEVFRSWSHVAVFRALIDTQSGSSGNEVARTAGMHPRSALKALSSLEVLGIVRRQRGGRDHIFTLNRDHILVRDALLPLYEYERSFPGSVWDPLTDMLRGKVMSAVIFGSVAKQQESPQSDLDLCCVVKSKRKMQTVRETLDSRASSLYNELGVKVAPIFFTLEEFRARAKSPLIKDIIANSKLVSGKAPKSLLNG